MIKKIGRIYSAIPGDTESEVMDVIEVEGDWFVGKDAFHWPECGCQLITFDIYNVPDDWKWMPGEEPDSPPPALRTVIAEKNSSCDIPVSEHVRDKFNVITGEAALQKIQEIVGLTDLGRLGLFDREYPYVIPMNHGMVGGELYLHGSFEGKKIDLMRQNPKVCYEIDKPLTPGPEGLRSCHLEYVSAQLFGTIREVPDPEERHRVLKTIMAQYGMPFKHGSEKLCQAYIITLEHASARTGRFRPHSQRDLYLYSWRQPGKTDEQTDNKNTF